MKRRLVMLLAMVIVGCTRHLERDDIPGAYEFQFDNLKQRITVAADGKYTNALYQGEALMWSDEGVWTYEEKQKGVTFAQFRFGVPGHSPRRGYWFVVPQNTLTGIKQLCFDPDLDRCFRSK